VDESVVEDTRFVVIFALAVGLGPVVAVEFTVALASRAGDARLVGVGLEEVFIAVATFDPAVVNCEQKRAAEGVVFGSAWNSTLDVRI
jgi:hypothetical protein